VFSFKPRFISQGPRVGTRLTLLELLVVMVIIGTDGRLCRPTLLRAKSGKSRSKTARAQRSPHLEKAGTSTGWTTGHYPTGDQRF